VRVPTHREPTHPGAMLLEEFLKPMSISQRDLADRIHVPYQRVNELVNGRRGITPSTALRLATSSGALIAQQAVQAHGTPLSRCWLSPPPRQEWPPLTARMMSFKPEDRRCRARVLLNGSWVSR